MRLLDQDLNIVLIAYQLVETIGHRAKIHKVFIGRDLCVAVIGEINTIG